MFEIDDLPRDWGNSSAELESGPESSQKVYVDDFIRPMTGEGREELEKLIHDDWHETIMKARRGDLSALQALSASTGEIPMSEAPGFCEVLCFHLRKTVPAVGNVEDISHVEQLALVSAHGIGELLNDFSRGDLENTFQVSWKAIARWLLYFNSKFLVQDPYNSQSLALSMAFLLAQATKFDGVKEQICSDMKTLKLVVSLWSEENHSFSADDSGFASKALAACGSFLGDARQTLINMVIRQDSGIPDVTALKLLGRIARAARCLPRSWIALDNYARVMMMFSSVPPQPANPVQLQLNLNEGVYDLNEMLSRVLVMAFPSPDDIYYESACSAVTKFITFFIYTFEQTYGSVLAGPALQSGFLKALIDFSPFLGQEPLQSSFCSVVTGTLVETLPRHLTTYSLLDKSEKALRAGYTEEAREKIALSPVAKEWELFEGFLLERVAYKSLFDDNQDKEGRSLRCGNPDCEKVDETNNFKLCAACKAERYCSKDCQLTAWKYKGHKQKCKKKATDSKEDKDDEFVLYCIRRDVIRHLPGLKNLARRQREDVDFNAIGIGIDYTTLPLTFEVYRLESLLDQVFGLEPDLERRLTRLLEKAEEGVKDEMFVRVILPQGKGHSKTMHVEVSLTTADAFTVPENERPSLEHTSKRPAGHDGAYNLLEVVAFDKVDQYLFESSRFEPMDVDEKPPQTKGGIHVGTLVPLQETVDQRDK